MRSSSLSVWTLLRHRLKAYWRTPFLGRRLASTILMALLGLSLILPLAGVGLFFDDIVGHLAPTADPLQVATRGLLPAVLGYGVSRMVIDSGLAVDPRPYQTLPVSRSALVGLLSVFALLSLWNVVPLAFVVPVCVEAALGGAGGAALRFGLACIGALAAVTYGVPMLRRGIGAYPFEAMGIVFLVGGGVGLAILRDVNLLGLLLDGSDWLFGGIVQGEILPLLVGLGIFGGIVGGHLWWLRRAMVVDRTEERSISIGLSGMLNRGAARHPVVQEALLVLRLFTRNFLLWITPSWMYPLYLSMVILHAANDSMNPITEFGGQSVATWALGTGMFSVFVSQHLFNYIGRYYSGLVARPVTIRTRVKGHLLFFLGGAIVLYLLPLPVAIWEPSFLLVHTAYFFYNVGVTTPVLLAAAPLAREAFSPHDWEIQSIDFSWTRLGLYSGVAAGAFIPLVLTDDPVHQLYLVGGMGLAACTAMPLWIRGLTALYRRNRYAMLEGFQASRDEH